MAANNHQWVSLTMARALSQESCHMFLKWLYVAQVLTQNLTCASLLELLGGLCFSSSCGWVGPHLH